MAESGTPWDQVGERVRAARQGMGISVRELARRVGVSASHVSQVERGIGAFSVPTLYAVADELGVSMNELLDPPGAQPNAAARTSDRKTTDLVTSGLVQRAADHPSIQLSSGPRWSRLTATGEVGAEFLEVVYQPETTAPAEYIRHRGREYGIVITGVLSVEVDGARADLASGDSIVFDSNLPHRFWNAGAEPVRAIWFVRDRDTSDPVPHP